MSIEGVQLALGIGAKVWERKGHRGKSGGMSARNLLKIIGWITY